MIYRIFPTKDTFITDAKKNNVPQTGSNFGASEILDLYKDLGVSGASGYAGSSSLARMLIKWDLSEIAALTASGDAPSTGSTYFLKLFDAKHAETLPSSFDIEIVPVSRSWDEGTGIDNDTFYDLGVANWDKAQSSVWWTTVGGDYTTGATASYHFDLGSEDVEVDISNIVGSWLTGSLVNNGLMVKLTDSQEADGNDYFKKSFFGRSTHYKDKKPTIEMRWDDSVKDDRSVFAWGVSSSLYLYNKVRGVLTNISGVGTGQNVLTVNITDASGTIATVSASHTGLTGIYSASFALVSSSYSGSVFNDNWGLNGASYMTGTFYPHGDGASSNNSQSEYYVKVKNIKKEYEGTETSRFNLFVLTRNYKPAVVNTGSLALSNTIIEKGYYRIDNAISNLPVIPLGTGSTETTRLSYDENGNYFNLHMNTLSSGEVYKVVFFFDVDGQFQKIDSNIRFKVV